MLVIDEVLGSNKGDSQHVLENSTLVEKLSSRKIKPSMNEVTIVMLASKNNSHAGNSHAGVPNKSS
jgi:hypothetical protein